MLRKNMKTFRPKKVMSKDSKRYELHRTAKATLHAGNLKKAVELPRGEHLCDWIAANTIDFFNQVNLLYGAVSDFCTPQTCPSMTAGPAYEYLWQGGKDYPKPTAVPAQRYVELLMAWIQGVLDDATVFPAEFRPDGAPPKDFFPTLKTVYKRLLRVYGHLYCSHFEKMSQLGIEAHLNTGFKHFYLFVREFKLIEDKKELAPLAHVIQQICDDYGLKP
jgi:MOB kinase activator 1